MAENYYEEDRIYPCDISGVCSGYGGCSHYPECAGWTSANKEREE